MKILFFSEGPSCFMQTNGRKDRQTDMTKLIVAFRNFANASKMTVREHNPLVILDKEGLFHTVLA